MEGPRWDFRHEWRSPWWVGPGSAATPQAPHPGGVGERGGGNRSGIPHLPAYTTGTRPHAEDRQGGGFEASDVGPLAYRSPRGCPGPPGVRACSEKLLGMSAEDGSAGEREKGVRVRARAREGLVQGVGACTHGRVRGDAVSADVRGFWGGR